MWRPGANVEPVSNSSNVMALLVYSDPSFMPALFLWFIVLHNNAINFNFGIS